ncbi:hypothetical protein [Microbacterium sp.]|uniref:hypothetical protein n=1 Tax=Microbacterium sp. TaxID=51671 RepID=UPI003F703FF5
MQTFVAVLMWLLVASLLILRRGRAERSITYAAVTIAVAMTINVDAVYQPLDALLGGSNGATLIGDCALMVGIFFLGRGIMKAGEYQPGPVRIALGPTTLLVALGGVVVAFLLIDRGATTTNFMIDLGAQPAAAAYSMIQFTYYGLVVGTMAVLASRQYRLSTGVQRLPAGSLVVGALLGVIFCVVVLIMDIAHLVGRVDVMSAVSIAYAPLYLLTFLFLCVGLAGQPTVRYLRARRRATRTRSLVNELSPAWRAATIVRPGLSQSDAAPVRTEGLEAQLHRQVVEIRDAMIDPRVTFSLSARDRLVLEAAERHLLGGDRARIHEPVGSATRRESQQGAK